MKVQSLSVSVPGTGCINNCKFCVSRMRPKDQYQGTITNEKYLDRLEFARDVGCNTMMITGTLEPQQNREFLEYLSNLNSRLKRPFRNIEIQTTGVGMSQEDFIWLSKKIGVKTVSISVSCLDSDEVWKDILGTKKEVSLVNTCKYVKGAGMNLRLSLNLTDLLSSRSNLFDACKNLEADQVTLRKMYYVEGSEWLKEHALPETDVEKLKEYIRKHCTYIDTLEYGQHRYSIQGMSVVLDEDCMAKEQREPGVLKYIILRENGKLYTKWDDPGSLLF